MQLNPNFKLLFKNLYIFQSNIQTFFLELVKNEIEFGTLPEFWGPLYSWGTEPLDVCKGTLTLSSLPFTLRFEKFGFIKQVDKGSITTVKDVSVFYQLASCPFVDVTRGSTQSPDKTTAFETFTKISRENSSQIVDLINSKNFFFDAAVKDIKIFEKFCKIRIQFHFKSSNSLHNIRNLKKKKNRKKTCIRALTSAMPVSAYPVELSGQLGAGRYLGPL